MDLTRVDLSSAAPHERILVRLAQFVASLWDQFNEDKVVIRASGLAYSSLLATVPLVAVLFALFSAFGAFDDIRQKVHDLIFNQLVPTRQDEIVGWIDRLIDNTQSIGFAGFVVLMITAVLLLDNIESNFNDIWHVRQRRSIVSKLTAYTSVLVFGTILIGVSVALSARLKAMLFTVPGLELSPITKLGGYLFPLAASFLAFLLMFVIIPATRVRWRSAMVGALFTSIAWELGKNLFANSVGQSVRYNTIYGSLAAFPIFLIWIYLTWVLVLIGLEVAYTHQNFAVLIRVRATGERPQLRQRLSLALKAYAMVAHSYHVGRPPPSCDEISDRLVVALPRVEDFMSMLVDAGLIREVVVAGRESGYVPAAPLEKTRLFDVLRFIIGDTDGPSPDDPPLEQAVDALISDFEENGRPALEGMTFRDFLEKAADK
jgi:membrane protein